MSTFTLIVIGVADNTGSINVPQFGLFDFWIELCINITSKIPDNFTEIIIYLHDIILYEDHFNISRDEIYRLLNQKIIETKPYLDQRIIIHDFSYKPFNILDISYPHLIIDMAHIFSYKMDKSIIWSNYYVDVYQHPQIMIEFMPLKSVYLGWNNREISSKKFIEITRCGYVRTFIECLIDSGFIVDTINDPIEILNNIIKQIKKSLMSIWRQIKKGVKSTDDGGHFDEMFESFSILDKILEKLFSNELKEEILNFETYEEYTEFNSKLNDPCYI